MSDAAGADRVDEAGREAESAEATQATEVQEPSEPTEATEATEAAHPAENERLRVLRLVAEGRISAAEGAELLAALDPVRRPFPPAPPVPPIPPVPPFPPFPPSGPFVSVSPFAVASAPHPEAGVREVQTLLISATDREGEVKVRLPLSLALDSSARFLSRRVRQRLEHHEIALEEILQHSAGLLAGSSPGQLIYVTDEEGELKIALE